MRVAWFAIIVIKARRCPLTPRTYIVTAKKVISAWTLFANTPDSVAVDFSVNSRDAIELRDQLWEQISKDPN